MLSEIQIDNVAVIEHADVRFAGGLNVLTGETGAGKSILIDSINAILGNRASREIVRTGASRASITAVFDAVTPRSLNLLKEQGYAFDGELILSRDITAEGKSSCRVNGRPCTAAAVRELVQDLVNIHGQLDNQELLDPERHIDILDRYAGIGLADYQATFEDLNRTVSEIQDLTRSERDKAARMDLLRYQVGEIDAAGLREGEEEELTARKTVIQNAEKLSRAYSEAMELISKDSDLQKGAMDLADEAAFSLERIAPVSGAASAVSAKLRDAADLLNEAYRDLEKGLGELSFSGEELEETEERLDLIFRLKRKYGDSVSEILRYREEAAAELEKLEFSDELLERLNARFRELKARALEQAKQLSEARSAAFPGFEGSIREELEFLNMPSVVFLVERKQLPELTAKGYDSIDFLISANAGESPRPLARIASGGEMARIMLAIKSVMAEKDGVPTLIFDEIDSGVSGKSAQRIGLKLKNTSAHHQIICVTHSAQVAAYADHHLRIEKSVRGERTYTTVSVLGREERAGELARIISGDNVTETALRNAEEMLRIAGGA